MTTYPRGIRRGGRELTSSSVDDGRAAIGDIRLGVSVRVVDRDVVVELAQALMEAVPELVDICFAVVAFLALGGLGAGRDAHGGDADDAGESEDLPRSHRQVL